jgi:hypothetical protein
MVKACAGGRRRRDNRKADFCGHDLIAADLDLAAQGVGRYPELPREFLLTMTAASGRSRLPGERRGQPGRQCRWYR